MSEQLDILDLSITLTPPPAGAPPETIASIALQCGAPLNLSHTGDLLTDPLTDKERVDLRWYLEEYWKWPYEGFAQRAKEIEQLLPKLGKRLYDAVFGSREADRIMTQWLSVQRDHQISIISDIPQALSLPWELLHNEQGYLVMRTRQPVSIIRRLPQSVLLTELSTSFEPPLRILLVTARPEGTGFLDPRGVARELLDEVADQVEIGTIALEFLRPPTLAALRNRLKDTTRPVHILHFDGHGIFEGEVDGHDELRKNGGQQGKLAFEDSDGKLDLVEADKLAQVLLDSGVRLAVLDACQSAMGSEDDAFSSVATRLIRGGIDNVVAMSASVLVAATTHYFEAFYRELVAGVPTSTAQERARQALHDDPRRHLMRRRRDDEGQPVELQDWWLPHFYQQRPLVLQSTRPSGQLDLPAAPSERLSNTMPAEPRYGFSGRAYELLHIERKLMRGQLVVIHGFGGVGKTALVRETADWLTRTKMYDAACFVSFEHGGDATTLLSALGNFVGVYDGSYNPNDAKSALAKLVPALKQKRTLVIVDNMESILPGGDAPLEAGVRSQLWDTLLKLSQMGAGVLLTTRDTNFGDGKMEPGKYVTHLPLAGLHPEDAYTLASRLLEYLDIDRAKAPYAELRDLLKQLDYHPLAIQLVLPALCETSLSLAKIKADFAALLPKFKDDVETGRNGSLLTSLDFSLRRLSDAQRALLPRLAVFEGGANENEILNITEIPDTEWINLRPALEQAALITVERVHENVTVPFLRFHPVLAPYLRRLQGADDEALCERYAEHYYELARYLHHEDFRNPQAVRALVRLELPNLRRALELLLEAGQLDDASDMADSIAWFLGGFGLQWERDKLRQRMLEIATPTIHVSGTLTRAKYLNESGLGQDELRKGNPRAASIRFTTILKSIEALPSGTPLGYGSYEHCVTLARLAQSLNESGQSGISEMHLRKALALIDVLINQVPDDQNLVLERGRLLLDLGCVLRDEGQYLQAKEMFEEALKIAKQQGDPRYRSMVLGELGSLMLSLKSYSEAQSYYIEVLNLFHSLGEQLNESVAWQNLGVIALDQEDWSGAERCFRESLTIRERLGYIAAAASNCNNLAIVARRSSRPSEAEGWYKRALELIEKVNPGGSDQATYFNNLAGLLVHEVQSGHSGRTRLKEAQSYGEQALMIRETLDASSRIWDTLGILTDIANLEGRTEEARNYRRRERETYAAFEGNRYHIDRQFGQLIADIAAAAKGDTQVRAKVEAALPEFEAKGWHISDTIHRIWAGERDWHSLTENMDREEALLILRVLETIAQPEEPQRMTPEQVFASLPVAIREAMIKGDQAALQQAFAALPPEDQQAVMAALQFLQRQQGEGEEEGGEE